MKRIKNLRVIKKVFEDRLPDHSFSLVDYFMISGNLDDYYIGNKYKNFKHNGFIKIETSDGRTLLKEQRPDSVSLFRHSIDDYYYFDVLDKNKKYELRTNMLYTNRACGELENLENLVKKKEGNL